MKSLVKAGLLMIGIMVLLVACGGGGGGGGTTPEMTLTADKSGASANGSDQITFTAAISPVQTAGTVTFTIPSTAVATFTDGTKTYSATISGSSANAVIVSSKAESVTVTATALGGSDSSDPVTFTAPQYSTQLWSADSTAKVGTPQLVWGLASPQPVDYAYPNNPNIKFTVISGNAQVSIATSTSDNYQSSVNAPLTTSGTYPNRATVNLKCTAAGNVIITAQCFTYDAIPYSLSTLTVPCGL